MPTAKELKASAEKEVSAIEKTQEDDLALRREIAQLGLTPEQAKFYQWVREVRAKGYVDTYTVGFSELTMVAKENTYFSINPTDNNGNFYDVITIAVNTNEDSCSLFLPTISQIVEQNIFPTIKQNIGFQIKIVNVGESGNDVTVGSAFSDSIGSINQIDLPDNASIILTPVFTNNWSAQVTK
jgi:hypothetical protein